MDLNETIFTSKRIPRRRNPSDCTHRILHYYRSFSIPYSDVFSLFQFLIWWQHIVISWYWNCLLLQMCFPLHQLRKFVHQFISSDLSLPSIISVHWCVSLCIDLFHFLLLWVCFVVFHCSLVISGNHGLISCVWVSYVDIVIVEPEWASLSFYFHFASSLFHYASGGVSIWFSAMVHHFFVLFI